MENLASARKVLDHGYIKLIEMWGSDEQIIESARMSTAKGFEGWGPKHAPSCGYVGMPDDPQRGCTCGHDTPGDEKLLRFLWENHHATPFEMGGFTIEVAAPIMVFREWHRHRTQSYNEMSARYTPLPDVSYVPSVERMLLNSKTNKQAGTIKGADELTEAVAVDLIQEEMLFNASAERFYQKKLKAGVPKELARTHIGVSRYSRMRASTDLRNWLGFLTLRMAPGAQWEIRQYANVVHEIAKSLFPRTIVLFDESAAR